MCNYVIRIFASLWSFISHRNTECLISKTLLMVFGLENNGPSFYYWTTAMKENAQLLASVVRWRGWLQEWLEMARVCRFSNIGQSVHWFHGYVLAVGMYCHLARNCVFVREQYWVQNGREISSSCLLLMCMCIVCHLCVCVLIVSCRAVLNLMVATSFLTADCLCFSFIALWNVRTDYLFLSLIR